MLVVPPSTAIGQSCPPAGPAEGSMSKLAMVAVFPCLRAGRSDSLVLIVRCPWSVVRCPESVDRCRKSVGRRGECEGLRTARPATDHGPRTTDDEQKEEPCRPHAIPSSSRIRCGSGARADLLAGPVAQAGLGESGVGEADRLPVRGGAGGGLPVARAVGAGGRLRAGRELPPAAGVDRRPARGRPDPDLPRRRRAALAPARVLAVPRRARRAARNTRGWCGRKRPRRASPIRWTAGSTPSCWRSGDGCTSGTAPRP